MEVPSSVMRFMKIKSAVRGNDSGNDIIRTAKPTSRMAARASFSKIESPKPKFAHRSAISLQNAVCILMND